VNTSQAAPVRPDTLVGAWDLFSWDLLVDDEPRPHGFGDPVTRQLLYLPSAHMSAILSDPDRAQLSVEPLAAAPADERAEAARAYVSYGGRWSV